jgi:hypothetical protein
MGNVLSFNGRGQCSDQVTRSTEYYTIMSDGRLSYTAEGIAHFSPVFRDHGIDIRKIETEDDHRVALDVCASEAFQSVTESEEGKLDDLEVKLLRSVMKSPDNEEAKSLEKQIKFRRRMIEKNTSRK